MDLWFICNLFHQRHSPAGAAGLGVNDHKKYQLQQAGEGAWLGTNIHPKQMLPGSSLLSQKGLEHPTATWHAQQCAPVFGVTLWLQGELGMLVHAGSSFQPFYGPAITGGKLGYFPRFGSSHDKLESLFPLVHGGPTNVVLDGVN